MKGPRWKQEEEQWLRQHGGSAPIDLLYSRYKRHNKLIGLPVRSLKAVRAKLGRMKISCRLKNDYLGLQELADALGRDRKCINYWIQKGLVISYKSKFCIYTSYGHVYEFAKKNPHYFGGIPQARLQSILGDERFCREIIRKYPTTSNPAKPKRVLCLETGLVYKSMHEAGAKNFISPGAIGSAIKHNRKTFGLTFVLYDKRK
jgi:hypothetical protein